MTTSNLLLIIDDEEDLRLSLQSALASEPYELEFAENGEVGITRFRETSPSLLLLDLRMPVMDGIEVLEALKVSPDDPYVIIVLTGHGDDEAVQRCYELGVYAFLRKPFNIFELRGLVKQTLAMKQAEMKSRESQLIAEKANRLKTEFLVNMSHELRTPLNSLLLLSESLKNNAEGNLSASQVESATYIHEDGLDLLDMVSDLLDMSKIEAGILSTFTEHIMVKDIGSMLKQKFSSIATKKGLPLLIDITADAPLAIDSDSVRINQVLKNFLSNAFKFSDNGEIKLTIFKPDESIVFRHDTLSKGNVIAFAVSDSGIGIPDDKLELIFDAFQQEDGTITRRYGGTGLGLTIARKLAGLLGGEIGLTSTHRVGSTFTLYLPLKIPSVRETSSHATGSDSAGMTASADFNSNVVYEQHPRRLSLDRNAPPTSQELEVLQGKRALLVDDDARNIYAISNMLSDVGMVITTATDGKTALDKATVYDYEVILMDIKMPIMDGYEATKKIRQIDDMKTIPIIALTASVMVEDQEKCIAAGASHYIGKPINVDHLLVILTTCLSKPTTRPNL